MEYAIQNWQQVYDDCLFLAQQIRESGILPEVILGVARGGWIPARLLADFLHLKDTANIKIETYQMINQEDLDPQITQPLSMILHDKRVLVVDDVVDSGVTLEILLDHLGSKHPADVITAALYYKPHAKIKPDYFVHETTAWILFSWSIFEAIEEFEQRWRQEGLTESDILTKLKQIGLSPPIVDSYFSRFEY